MLQSTARISHHCFRDGSKFISFDHEALFSEKLILTCAVMLGCRLLWGGHGEDCRQQKQTQRKLHLADCAASDLPPRLYTWTAFGTTHVTNIYLYITLITSDLLNFHKSVIVQWEFPTDVAQHVYNNSYQLYGVYLFYSVKICTYLQKNINLYRRV
jgi:hypothetical protein